jgi:hypothetical protein
MKESSGISTVGISTPEGACPMGKSGPEGKQSRS